MKPDTPFSCPSLEAGGEYMFWVRAVNCGDQEGEESQPLVVRPQGKRSRFTFNPITVTVTVSSQNAEYFQSGCYLQLHSSSDSRVMGASGMWFGTSTYT